jgi:hypothetical protein
MNTRARFGSDHPLVMKAAEKLGCPAGRLLAWRITPGGGLVVIGPDGRKTTFSAGDLVQSANQMVKPVERRPA